MSWAAEALGTKVNLPLDAGTGERGWLSVLQLVLPELADQFKPDVIVSQHGADAHAFDPLAHLPSRQPRWAPPRA